MTASFAKTGRTMQEAATMAAILSRREGGWWAQIMHGFLRLGAEGRGTVMKAGFMREMVEGVGRGCGEVSEVSEVVEIWLVWYLIDISERVRWCDWRVGGQGCLQ